MCTDCGCSSPQLQHGHHPHRTVRIEEDLLSKNARLAQANRATFAERQLFVLNLVSSPGSGKTTLLERTLTDLKNQIRFAVVEGDQQTTMDADRIAATGIPVKQVNTGAGCHLDAHMIVHGTEGFDLSVTDVLLIENVGNLVCPAAFDLGEDHKVAVLSVTEGEDKPLKYPHMFRAADLMLINKIDLLPYVNFDLDQCKSYARQVNPTIEIIDVSCQSSAGLQDWYDWLKQGIDRKRGSVAARAL